MSDLLFIRHAETDMAGKFCGHSNPPINPRGSEQLRGLVEKLQGSSIDAIVSSDLQRAATTAEALATSFNLPISLNLGLREINFGDWEGSTWSEIQRRDPAHAQRWIEDYPKMAAPGGETFCDFQKRVLNLVAVLSHDPNNRRTAVITHGGVMRIVLQSLCGFDEQTAWERTKEYCCSFLYIPGDHLDQPSEVSDHGGVA